MDKKTILPLFIVLIILFMAVIGWLIIAFGLIILDKCQCRYVGMEKETDREIKDDILFVECSDYEKYLNDRTGEYEYNIYPRMFYCSDDLELIEVG